MLHLIAKHKLNINDIPITVLVDQYLDYIGQMAENDMEIAGEFLEMAARLIYIKTVSLLPRHEEAEQLKKELQGRLVEYSICREMAAQLREMYSGDVIFVRKPMKLDFDTSYNIIHDAEVLRKAYLGIGVKKDKDEPVTSSAFSALVSKKFVPVTAKIVYILRRLYDCGKCSLGALFDDMESRSDRIAAFLAVLELTKSGRICLNSDSTEITFNSEYVPEEGDEVRSDFDEEDKKENDDDDIR